MRKELHYLWRNNGQSDAVQHCLFSTLLPRLHPTLPLHLRHELYELGSDTGLHRHADFYALYVVRSGRGIHVINDHPYGIARGDVYLLPPGAIHAYRDYCALAIDAFYFQPQLFGNEELAALRALAGFWRLLITFAHPPAQDHVQVPMQHRFHLPPERQHDVEQMVAELYEEYTGTQPVSSLLTRGLFFRLLVHLARWQSQHHHALEHRGKHNRRTQDIAVPTATTKGTQAHQDGIPSVVRFCEEHFHEPLSVPQLAALLFLSPSRFSELFQREIGMSPAAYIRRLRLERAQTLLRTTTLTSTEIAHQVGFRDSAQLSRAFRDLFHLTPTAYRAAFQHS